MAETHDEKQAATLADLPQLASCKQVAQVCGVTSRQVARLCERGEIQAVRLGKLWRINRDALAEKMGL